MSRPDLLIRLASVLVPLARRQDWVKEWLAELHYAQQHAGEAQSYAFARGAFHDALWQQRDFWTLKRTKRLVQSPWFCLGSAAALLIAITLASGLLPLTRLALMPLSYREPDRVVLITRARTMGTREAVPAPYIAAWRGSTQTLDGIATYRWKPGENVAQVSENFFSLLGVDVDLHGCAEEACVVLSRGFAHGHGGRQAVFDGKTYRVAGVTDPGFWFLSTKIVAWRIESLDKKARAGVVARLRPGVTANDAALELSAILRASGVDAWDALLEFTGVASRVRVVLWIFLFSIGISILIIFPTIRFRMPAWNPRAGAFFLAKTGLLLLAVLLFGIEFLRASSITMLGGADGYMALSAWLLVMGSTGVLAWSIADQRQRCRVCLKRLGMAAHVGCTGCLLLDWAGTELVCVEGHGMLHVPEMVACWQEPDKWTFLDETWQELFERST